MPLGTPEACAAIHKQRLTCHESGTLAGKKRDRCSNLTRLREPTHRHSRQIAGFSFTALRIVGTKRCCLSRAWRDGIRGNAIVRVMLSSAAFAAASLARNASPLIECLAACRIGSKSLASPGLRAGSPPSLNHSRCSHRHPEQPCQLPRSCGAILYARPYAHDSIVTCEQYQQPQVTRESGRVLLMRPQRRWKLLGLPSQKTTSSQLVRSAEKEEGWAHRSRSAYPRVQNFACSPGKPSHKRASGSASPKDQSAAASNTRSLRRNWPGIADSAGKPPKLGSQPGVEKRKVSVVRNITAASPLPIADTVADTERSAIIAAMAISTTPSRAENARSLKMA